MIEGRWSVAGDSHLSPERVSGSDDISDIVSGTDIFEDDDFSRHRDHKDK